MTAYTKTYLPTIYRVGRWAVALLTLLVTLSAVRTLLPSYLCSSPVELDNYAHLEEEYLPPAFIFNDSKGRTVAQRYSEHPLLVETLHVVPSFIWAIGFPLQFYAGWQKTRPQLHHFVGYTTAAVSFLMGQTGPAMCLMGACYNIRPGLYAFLDLPMLSSLSATYYSIALYKGITAARERKISQHRRWMMRHASVGYGIMLQRLYIMAAALQQFSTSSYPRDSTEKSAVFWTMSWAAQTTSILVVEVVLQMESRSFGKSQIHPAQKKVQ